MGINQTVYSDKSLIGNSVKNFSQMDCACEKCVNACRLQPGWFAPGEAEKAAELLGMPFDQFKKFLIIDHCDNHSAPDAPYLYAPRKLGVDQDNVEIRGRHEQKTRGPCIFFKNDRCSIHAAKPYECRKMFACIPMMGKRDEIEQLWIRAGSPLGMRPEEGEDKNG